MSSRSKSSKYILVNCGLLLPSTTIPLLISNVILAVILVFSLLAISEFVAPEEWRWVVCGMGLFVTFCYFVWTLAILFALRRRITRGLAYSANGSSRDMYKKSKRSYATSLELQHVIPGFILFGLISILWAAQMGAQPNSQFVSQTNAVNYLILKTYYVLNSCICILMIPQLFSFTIDYLRMAKS